jgi:hypothetical protein
LVARAFARIVIAWHPPDRSCGTLPLSARPGPSAALKKSSIPVDSMNAPQTGVLQY